MLKYYYKNLSDSIIWEKIRSGDHNAYSYIYKKYAQEMFSYGYYISKDKDLIKDCIQDIFLRIYRNKNSLGDTNNIKFYLLYSLKNQIIQRLREQSKLAMTDLDEFTFSNLYFEENTYADKEEQQIQNEKIHIILNSLPPRQKEAIYYRYIEELSINEISLIMNLNYQSSQNLIQRALKKLQKILHL